VFYSFHIKPVFSIGLLSTKEFGISQIWLTNVDYEQKEKEETVRLETENAIYNAPPSVLEKINTRYSYISFGGKPVLFILPAKFHNVVMQYKDTASYKNKLYAYNFYRFLQDKLDPKVNDYIYTCSTVYQIWNREPFAYRQNIFKLYWFGRERLHDYDKDLEQSKDFLTYEVSKKIVSKAIEIIKKQNKEQYPLNRNLEGIFRYTWNKSTLKFIFAHNYLLGSIYRKIENVEADKNASLIIYFYRGTDFKALCATYMIFHIHSFFRLLNFLYGYSQFDLPITYWMTVTNYSECYDEYDEVIYRIGMVDVDNMRLLIGREPYLRPEETYIVEPSSVKLKSLDMYKIALGECSLVLAMKGINKVALMFMMKERMTANIVFRITRLLVNRYKKIREIHPNMHKDHLIACSFLCKINVEVEVEDE